MAGAKQVMDAKPGKGISSGVSNEQLRDWTEKGWDHAESVGNYDRTRMHLNFEIQKGGIITPVDTTRTLMKRFRDNLRERGIKDPNEGLEEPKFRTCVNFIFGGSKERMREMAFGNQEVDFDRKQDNSHIERKEDIENWAKDVYDFVCKKFREKNVLHFVVHLDETNPHVHCTILPITESNKFSYKMVFGGKDIYDFKKKMTELHDELAEVNKKWGLERGTSVSETGAKHRSTEEYRRHLNQECTTLEEEITAHRSALRDLKMEISIASRKQKSFTTMIENLEKQKESLQSEIQQLQSTAVANDKDQKEIEEKLRELQDRLNKTESDLGKRQEMLKTTNERLNNLMDDFEKISLETTRMQNEKRDAEHQMNHFKSELEKFRLNLSDSFSYHMKSDLIDRVVNEFIPRFNSMSEEQKDVFEGTLLADLAERGNAIIGTAMYLMLGAIQEAAAFAESHGGGGGGPSSGWGKDDDEDDREWARRCVNEARKMCQPSVKKKRRM